MAEQVSYYEDPKEIEKKIWELLTQAVTNRTSNFRTPVFICGNAEDIDGRVVVLRKADQENSFVQFHSDLRSTKIPKVRSNPNCAFLFYDKEEKIQVRIKSICSVHQNDDVTKEAWSKTQHISRKCYLVKDGPGTLSETPTSGLEKSAILRLRKEPDENLEQEEVEEEENDDFENLYKGQISKSGIAILPSKRTRKIPEAKKEADINLADAVAEEQEAQAEEVLADEPLELKEEVTE